MKYVATGRIHPERADVTFSPMRLQCAGGGTLSVACESSQVTVVVDDVAGIDGFIGAFILAKDMAATAAASLGFALGSGYTVEMIQILGENGESHVFGVRPGNLHFEPHLPVFASAARVSGLDLFFRHALQDYVRAISTEVDCAFLCYRAIEAISASFEAREGGNGWAAMHAALATDRAQIETTVKDFADPVRHGNWPTMKPTTSVQRNAMLLLTMAVLEKYLNWVLPNPNLQPTARTSSSEASEEPARRG